MEGYARWEVCIALTRVTGQREATGLCLGAKVKAGWAVGAHTFNPSTQEAEAGGSLFEASLVYRGSFRISWAT